MAEKLTDIAEKFKGKLKTNHQTGEKERVTDHNSVLLVDLVREYLNEQGAVYDSFYFGDLHNRERFSFPHFNKVGSPLVSGNNDPTGENKAGFDYIYCSVLKAYKHFEKPINKYYMYVASHDGDGIYLYTSGSLERGWKPYNKGEPILSSGDFIWGTEHISSPDVHFDNTTKKVLLYIHTPLKEDITKQWTSLATSDDGINFSPYDNKPILVPEHLYRFNGKSTSYFKACQKDGVYYGVFQANSVFGNRQADGVTTSIGSAISNDGYTWELSTSPLLSNKPGEIGPFSPALIYFNGHFLILYRSDDMSIQGFVADDFDQPKYHEESMIVIPKGKDDEWDNLKVSSPYVIYENGILYVFYGGIGKEQSGVGLVKGVINDG